ncbi:Cytosolic phospholipase A2 zeta [Hondaea fermentalgiana]|uniref:Cytosolic phospholipase A2 zeta n=1 Tax=Hondaea fermentalgiana TaxID=2315210 RepID=A0A2R5GJ59_9STRA|nr:Cytosolic phospholipase A2 zeta [Hondaea fermentalgiana]|eukprot:GBG30927.1 Cytosolic phospholipase A2 zeta [Hondaea fermentalgiana]
MPNRHSARSLVSTDLDLSGAELFADDDDTRLTRRSRGKSLRQHRRSRKIPPPVADDDSDSGIDEDTEEDAASARQEKSHVRQIEKVLELEDELQSLEQSKGQAPKPAVRKRRASKRVSARQSPEDWLLQGYLKKGEWRAPTQCGCFPVRERQYKDKFAAIDVESSALVYAKTRHMIVNETSKRIPFADIARVELEGPDSNKFRVFIKQIAQERHKSREYYSWAAVDHASAQQWIDALSHATFLHATVYQVGPTGTFPEAELGVRPLTAICISGGGARSHTATCGTLRALQHLQLLNTKDVNYMSTVSGSAWATSIYMFYQEGAETDDELLGPRTSLNDLHLDYLSDQVMAPILKPATVDLWRKAESLFWSTNTHEWWERTVAEIYLEPFGLNDDYSFGHPDMAAALQAQNHYLANVRLAHKNRPFWIANAAILGPQWALAGDLFPIQFTPMYSGSPFKRKMHLRGLQERKRHEDVYIGGTMIDSFAFGSDTPLSAPKPKRPSLKDGLADGFADGLKESAKVITNAATEMVTSVFATLESLVKDHPEQMHRGVSKRSVMVAYPDQPLTLRHAIGISSHAPAFIFKNSKFMERLNPRNKLWAPQVGRRGSGPTPDHPEEATEMDFADGGVIDNVGLLAMLQRQVRRVCVFVNSEIKVPLHRRKPRARSGRVTSLRKSLRRMSIRSRSSRSIGEKLKGRLDELHQTLGDEQQTAAKLAEHKAVFESSDSVGGEEEEEDDAESVNFDSSEASFDGGYESFLPEYEDWPQASVLPLFGIDVPIKGEFGVFSHNQVFRKGDIVNLLEQFQQAKVMGEPLIAEQTYEVLPNEWWGIKGGWDVTIMWVYLEKVRSFELQLPRETTEEIDKGRKGLFPHFPNYKTFGQKKGKWIEPALTTEQANLLAAQCEWTILHEADRFTSFFRDAEKDLQRRESRMVQNLHEKGFV